MELAILRPTRGLEFSESADSIDVALRYVPYVRGIPRRTWDKPIPDSFNWLVEWYLRDTRAPYALIVEEDIVLPPNAIEELFRVDTDIAAINYLSKWDKKPCDPGAYGRDVKIVNSWTGCVLIKRHVFDRMTPPWFRTDKTVAVVHEGSTCPHKTIEFKDRSYGYGGHDLYFIARAQMEGFSLGYVPDLACEHLKLDAEGKQASNDGCHKISRVKACP